MLLMAASRAGTRRALRGFGLKLQQLCGWAPTPGLTYLQRLALSLHSSSFWVSSAGMKRPDGLGNDEVDDEGSGFKEAGGGISAFLLLLVLKLGEPWGVGDLHL